jgi:hypothetical protein
MLGKDSQRCLVNGGALFGAQRREHAWLGLVEQALDLPQQPLSVGGDSEDLAAAVALIALTHHQRLVLESVDEGDDVASVDTQAPGDVLLTGGAVLVQAAQDRVLVLAQADRGELHGALLPRKGRQPGQDEAGTGP